MLLSVEMVTLERIGVTVHLMVLFVVYILEEMGVGLSLLHLKPWRIGLQVFFATPCLLSVVLGDVRSITFDTPGPMCSAS